MGKKIMILAIFVLSIYNLAYSENKLSVSNIEIIPYEWVEVSVSLDNDEPFVAFQFDLHLPVWFEIRDVTTNPERIPMSTTVLEKKIQSSNEVYYRFITTAMQSEPIMGNRGEIIHFYLRLGGIEPGLLSGHFSNIKLSRADATGPSYESFHFPVNVCSAAVIAYNNSRDYGDENPSFTYWVSGDIEGSPVITCDATSNSPVGEYDIKIERGR